MSLVIKEILVKISRALIVFVSWFPLKFHYFMGDILAWIAKNVIRYRTDVVMVNLSRAFPDRKYKGIRKIYDEYYTHFGEMVAETLWFGGSSYARLRRNGIVKVMNVSETNRIYSECRSMTVLSTHCGNWELLGGLLGYETDSGEKLIIKEKDITVVYKKLSSEVSDKVFALNRVAPLEEVGTECEVESRNVLRYAIRHAGERRMYIYPTDQSPYSKTGRHMIGDFMSQPTYAMMGSVGVACKMAHAVMYMKMKRVRRGYYEMSLVPICEDASKMSPETIMRKYYDLLEEEIRETPANWLWSHKRWKHK